MDKIINILLLVIIFVFDPLAISLVIASNFAFSQAYSKKRYKENLYGEQIEEDFSEWDNLEDIEEETKSNLFPDDYDEENEKRMNIIGQNGNEGEHYEKEEFNILDTDKDGVVNESEKESARNHIKSLENQLKSGISSWRKSKIQNEINKFKQALNDTDETKTY